MKNKIKIYWCKRNNTLIISDFRGYWMETSFGTWVRCFKKKDMLFRFSKVFNKRITRGYYFVGDL